MATNNNDSIQVRYSDPIYLNVTGAVDNSGNSEVGGYLVYLIKTDGDVPDLNSGISSTQKFELVTTIYPETAISYSGRINAIGDTPRQRFRYQPEFIYPVEYYTIEENKDHYFYLAAFDKSGNVSSGFISHPNNPFRGPSVFSRAVQWGNRTSNITIYNSGSLYPSATSNSYPSGTLSFWIRFAEEHSAPGLLIEKLNSNITPNFSPIGVHVGTASHPNRNFRFYLGSGGQSPANTDTYVYWDTTSVSSNSLNHIVFVWSGISNYLISGTIYINGVKDTTYSGTKIPSGWMPAGALNSNLSLGTRSGAYSYSGVTLDGIHFYNTPFTLAQVQELYSGQLHGIRGTYNTNALLAKYSFNEGSGVLTYANYPILSPPVSGLLSGDVRWVKPLYIELREDNINTEVLQFFNTYVDISGNINSGVIDPQNVSFQNRIFTSDAVKTQVEGLNNGGAVADGVVPNSSMVDTRILYADVSNKIYDLTDASRELDGSSALVDASVSDGKIQNTNILYLQNTNTLKKIDTTTVQIGSGVIGTAAVTDDKLYNTKILYLQDANTLKQVDGTTKILKYTTLSGVQEYRHVWSSVDTKPTGPSGDATTTYYTRGTSGIIAYVPFIAISGSDTLIRMAARLITTSASVPAVVSVGTCYPNCTAAVTIFQSTSTGNYESVSGVINLGNFQSGPSAIAIYLGPNGVGTVSGYWFTVEVGNH